MVPEPAQALVAHEAPHLLSKRDDTRTKGLIIFAVVLTVVLCTTLAFYFSLRYLRMRNARPTYLPTTFLRTKWRSWTPASGKRRPPSSLHQDVRRGSGISMISGRTSSPADVERLSRIRASQGDGYDSTSLGARSGHTAARSVDSSSRATTEAQSAGVDRNTSVRSIMTLPAYSATARPSEKIMGREGERAGMDSVVEFPEEADEEEARREEEMESLYQIREARRQERAARDLHRRTRQERRTSRRQARERGNRQELRELRVAAVRSGGENTTTLHNPDSVVMMAQHASRERGRRVSSVAYASLGVARHDGSRVRSDSATSDNRPLLENGAAMASRDRDESPAYRPRSETDLGPLPAPPRFRERNVSSSSLSRFISAADGHSDSEQSSVNNDARTPMYDSDSRSRSRSRGASEGPSSRLRLGSTDIGERTLSGQSLLEGPVGEDTEQVPPPDYENLSPIQQQRQSAQVRAEGEADRGEAPPYSSPIRDQAPTIGDDSTTATLSLLTRLPSIQVTSFSPFERDPPTVAGSRGWFE